MFFKLISIETYVDELREIIHENPTTSTNISQINDPTKIVSFD